MHTRDKNLSTWAISCCLPGCMLAGSWILEQTELHSDLEVGTPSGVSTCCAKYPPLLEVILLRYSPQPSTGHRQEAPDTECTATTQVHLWLPATHPPALESCDLAGSYRTNLTCPLSLTPSSGPIHYWCKSGRALNQHCHSLCDCQLSTWSKQLCFTLLVF